MSLVMAFVVGAMGVFLMMGGLGEGQQATTETIEYPEHGSGAVVAYTALDPEGESVTWSVSGSDRTLFEIDGGRLTFKTPPDFEDPRDVGPDNDYNVAVVASDGSNGLILLKT